MSKKTPAIHWTWKDKGYARCGANTLNTDVDIAKVTCARCKALHEKDEAKKS